MTPPEDASARATLGKGSTVRLVARPDVVGVVVDVRDVGADQQYSVFHGDTFHTYFAAQIELVDVMSSPAVVTMADLRAGLTSELVRDTNSGYLQARNSGRIDHEPYQFRPVLKLVESDLPRILIADDVGVGKTIEACLIMKELQARHRAERVLVICPKPLVVDDKWRSELKRFDEDFVHLTGADLRFCIDETQREGEWPRSRSRAILPYSLLDEKLLTGGDDVGRRPGLLDIAPQPAFDLVVVDEAHHIRNSQTWAYRCVKQIIASAGAVVFMSATPLQTRSEDLFTLLNLLRDDLVPTQKDFAQMLEPNRFLHRAADAARAGAEGWQHTVGGALDDAVTTPWGQQVLSLDPRLPGLRRMLTEHPDDLTRVRTIRAIEDLNTLAPLVTRTRRRDIGTFTQRKPSTREVEFTADQAEVYTAVLDLGRRIARHRTPGMPTEFLLSMLHRQAASSIHGLAPLIDDLLTRRLGVSDVAGTDLDVPDPVDPFEGPLRQEIAAVRDRAGLLVGRPDPKLDVFGQVIADKQGDERNKVLVFSTFRHTLAYLYSHASSWGARVGLVHGAVDDAERHALRRRFALARSHPDAIDVLLCSEVGTEGLDFQFCDTLVNYDIPWNPMRVEQRIGRIDRRGQPSETVAIVNIITKDTVEADIYERCLARIGVFQQAIGGSEEILGELTSQIRRIGDDLTLTPDERRERLQQLTDNQMRHTEEVAALEERQAALVGLSVDSIDAKVAQASTHWLDGEQIIELVRRYLDGLSGTRRTTVRAGRPVVFRLSEPAVQQLSAALDRVANSGRLQQTLHRAPALHVTTEPAIASNDPTVELLSVAHPLVLAAAKDAALTASVTAHATARSDLVAPGRYAIAIHRWTRLDLRDTSTLRYVCTEPDVEVAADALLAQAVDAEPWGASLDDALDERHHALWSAARSAHVDNATALARRRVAALEVQRDRQLATLDQLLTDATDPRIRTMRQGERASVERRFAELIERHRDGGVRADLTSQPLATVLLEVTGP